MFAPELIHACNDAAPTEALSVPVVQCCKAEFPIAELLAPVVSAAKAVLPWPVLFVALKTVKVKLPAGPINEFPEP